MKISKSSWHYRFTEAYGVSDFERRCAEGRHTTCSYIRAVFYATLRAFVAFSALAVVAAFFLFFAVSMVVMPFVIAAGVVIVAKTLLDFMLAACVLGWIIASGILIIRLICLLADKVSDHKERRQSLIAQAYKDKKDGVCTLIEVVE